MSSPNTVATVRRTTVSEQFTIIPNAILRGRLPVPIHALARCILLHLLSLPEGWRINRAQLDEAFLEGDTAIKTALRELRDAGYLLQERTHGVSGGWRWTWHVTDDPTNRPLQPATDETDGQQLTIETAGQTIGGQTTDGSASDGNPPIKEEDGSKKTDPSRRDADASDGDESHDDAPTLPRPDVEQLCEHLAHRVAGNGCKRPTITKRWRDEARRMLDRDGRPLDEALRLIDWCQADQFWRSNVLSLPKFREKYDQLRLRAVDTPQWRELTPPEAIPDDEIDPNEILGPRPMPNEYWPPDDMEQGSIEWQDYMRDARARWKADRIAEARKVLARRRAVVAAAAR